MTITAAHLRELTALGIVGETLVRVVEIIDEASALSADKSADVRRGPLESTANTARKERDKQRKRLARAAEKAARTSAQSSLDMSASSADSPLSDCVVLTSLVSEDGLQERKKEEQRVRARGTRLAPGARLSAEHRAIIIAEGIHDPEKLWVEFVDYWSDIPGQRGVKISWTGTLRNRCRDVLKRGFNGHGTHNSHQRRSSSSDFFAGIASVAADIAGDCQPSGLADEEIPLGRFNIDG